MSVKPLGSNSPSPAECRALFLPGAQDLIGDWQPGEAIRRTYRYPELQTIAAGTDPRCTHFLSQYIENKSLSSSKLNAREFKNPLNCTLLCTAARLENQAEGANRVEMLLNKGIKPNGCNGFDTPLHSVTRPGNLAAVEALLRHRANVNARNGADETPLHLAVKNGNLAVVEALLRHRANVNVRNETGKTPLHLAVKNGNLAVVEALLRHRANVNVRNGAGKTPLHLAAENGQIAICRHLLARGAFPGAKDEHGKTPLELANSLQDNETRGRIRAEFRRFRTLKPFAHLLQGWAQNFRKFRRWIQETPLRMRDISLISKR
ncbi:MAG: hypothetical protein C5B47_07070 [Verrucomicrobia bacterium]|nr:MAG: hypothetical protein C5B47_07070 [Verrucomicrobiota bacterium]